jgi:quinolinate synthase
LPRSTGCARSATPSSWRITIRSREIQDLADFVGDSLDLSRKAAETDADVIAFCGVRFMAETAKILSPQKIVILPDMDAGCSLEDSCPPDQFKAFREAHPDHIALTYINCSAQVKALSDIIVTSSSAEKILSQIPDQKIIFGPDKHLGGYLKRKLGRDMLLWPGVCIVHEAFSETELLKLKAQHPGAPGRSAPRMPAAHSRSCRLCRLDQRHPRLMPRRCPATRLIVATEPHIIHQMQLAAPQKTSSAPPARTATATATYGHARTWRCNTSGEALHGALRDLTTRRAIDNPSSPIATANCAPRSTRASCCATLP